MRTQTHTERGPSGIQGEGGRLQAKDRGLARNQPWRHCDRGFPASRIVRKYISVVSRPGCDVLLCNGKPTKWILNPVFPIFFIPYKEQPLKSHQLNFNFNFMHPLSQQAFEYLFYLEFQGKELDGLFIYSLLKFLYYSLLKFLSIDEKIEGNINFFLEVRSHV